MEQFTGGGVEGTRYHSDCLILYDLEFLDQHHLLAYVP